MNFHEQLSAWQADLAGAAHQRSGAAAFAPAMGHDAQRHEALRLFEALAERFNREMGVIAPKKPVVSTPGALPC